MVFLVYLKGQSFQRNQESHRNKKNWSAQKGQGREKRKGRGEERWETRGGVKIEEEK